MMIHCTLAVVVMLLLVCGGTSAYTLALHPGLRAEAFVVPEEAAFDSVPYRVFRTLRLSVSNASDPTSVNSTWYEFREPVGGYPTDVAPPPGTSYGAIAASRIRTAVNCSHSAVLLDAETGAVISGTSATVPNDLRNIYVLMNTGAQLIPLSPTEAVLLLLPSRSIFEALRMDLRVSFLVLPSCLEDSRTHTPLQPSVNFFPITISVRLEPMRLPFTVAQDYAVLAMSAVGIVMGAPHAAAHAPRVLLGVVTRQCLPFPQCDTPLSFSPLSASITDVDGEIANDPAIGMLAFMLLQWGGLSVGVSVVGLVAVLALAYSRRNSSGHSAGSTLDPAPDAESATRGRGCCASCSEKVAFVIGPLVSSCVTLRFPSIIVLSTLPLFAPISFSSTALLLSLSDETVALLGVGGISWILLVVLVLLLCMIGAFRSAYTPWNHVAHCPLSNVRALSEDEALAASIAASRQLDEPVDARRNAMLSVLFGHGKWEDIDVLELGDVASAALADGSEHDGSNPDPDREPGDLDTIGSGPFTRCARLLLQEYDDQGSFFICVDLMTAAITGGIQGASVSWKSSYGSCATLLYAQVSVLGLYFLIALLRRPFRSGYVTWLNIVLTSVEVASVSWELYRTLHPVTYANALEESVEEKRDAISHAIVNGGLCLVGVKLLLDVVIAGHSLFRCVFTMRSDHGRGELRRRREQHKRRMESAMAAQRQMEQRDFMRTSHMVDEELGRLVGAILNYSSELDKLGEATWRSWLQRIMSLRLQWSLCGGGEDELAEVRGGTDDVLCDIRRAVCPSGCSSRQRSDVLRKCETVEAAVYLVMQVWNKCHAAPSCIRPEVSDDDEGNAEGNLRTIRHDDSMLAMGMRKRSVRRLLELQCASSSSSDESTAEDCPAVPVAQCQDNDSDPEDVLRRRESLARIDQVHIDVGGVSIDGGQRSISPRFRSSRALFGHVCCERTNYVVAPGTSKANFLSSMAKRPETSTFSSNDSAFSRHLYNFEEI